MHISLTSRLEELVKEKVQTGLYNNASEVIREALRFMEQQEQVNELKFQVLRDAVRLGASEADRGLFSDRSVDEIIEEQLQKEK